MTDAYRPMRYALLFLSFFHPTFALLSPYCYPTK
jgi:hypothetical protein